MKKEITKDSNLVVKDNALINAGYNLGVAEQRLVLLAVVTARETGKGITPEQKLRISAQDYATRFNVSTSVAYRALQDAVDNLFERRFSYQELSDDGILVPRKSRWISDIGYLDDLGAIEMIFTPKVVTFITRLEERFTSYQLNQIAGLKSKYAIRLYEISVAWRAVGNTPIISVEDLRYMVGVEDSEYLRMTDFKARVLEPAIKQINKKTDINIKYEQQKEGTSITGFQFFLEEKTKPAKEPKAANKKADGKDADMQLKLKIARMSDSQIKTFAGLLAKDASFGSKHGLAGEKTLDLELRIIDMLVDPAIRMKLKTDLVRVGFK